MDTNTESARQAESEAFGSCALALDQTSLPPELYLFIGNVLALTDNRDLNQLICEVERKWAENMSIAGPRQRKAGTAC